MTDFIYRKENALSFDFCRSLIELFEIDKELKFAVYPVKSENPTVSLLNTK